MTDIYIKTEPAGRIIFGELDDEQGELLIEAVKNKSMSDEVLDLKLIRRKITWQTQQNHATTER